MQSTVAEFCLWKMFKVEIDSVADEKRKNEKKMLCTDENRGWGESIVENANVTGEQNSVQMPDPRSYFSQHFVKNFIPS